MTDDIDIWIPKLYIVTRKDLTLGARACQGMHAMREFADKHPDVEKFWYKNSNHLAFLETEDILELEFLVLYAEKHNILYATFHEPDFGHKLTAVAFEPSLKSRELLKELPRAMKNL